jgi:hypothetical protein
MAPAERRAMWKARLLEKEAAKAALAAKGSAKGSAWKAEESALR